MVRKVLGSEEREEREEIERRWEGEICKYVNLDMLFSGRSSTLSKRSSTVIICGM